MSEKYSAAHKAVLDSIFLAIPAVKAGQAFGYPAYKYNGKIIAFLGGTGVALKLMCARVSELVAARADARYFQPTDKITWHDWVQINNDDAEALRADEDLCAEAVEVAARG
jgi:hypothetical protein